MLQTAREKSQPNRQQRAPKQRLEQRFGRFFGVVCKMVFPPRAQHEQHDADARRPQRAFLAEKTMIHRARNKTNPRIFQQHTRVLRLK